jgi:hypothetical protein
VYHLISSHPGLPEPPNGILKTKAEKQRRSSISLFHAIPNWKHVKQMLAYLNYAIGFIQALLYWPYQFHGDTALNENNIQDPPPNWIISYLEVYK